MLAVARAAFVPLGSRDSRDEPVRAMHARQFRALSHDGLARLDALLQRARLDVP